MERTVIVSSSPVSLLSFISEFETTKNWAFSKICQYSSITVLNYSEENELMHSSIWDWISCLVSVSYLTRTWTSLSAFLKIYVFSSLLLSNILTWEPYAYRIFFISSSIVFCYFFIRIPNS